jgi:hypothetical protein
MSISCQCFEVTDINHFSIQTLDTDWLRITNFNGAFDVLRHPVSASLHIPASVRLVKPLTQ